MARRRWRHMVRRLLFIYAVVELAAIIALVSTIGVSWTLLVLLGAFVLGFAILAPAGGWQLSRQLVYLRLGLQEPRSALSDGAIVTVATGLVLVPGLVTTALGLLLLVPPIRAIARPGLTAIAVRGFQRRAPLITDTTAAGDGRDFIDGEVIDVWDVPDVSDVSDVSGVDPLILPQGPIRDEPPPRPTSSAGSI
jgi:UPF0716 protein FxsA